MYPDPNEAMTIYAGEEPYERPTFYMDDGHKMCIFCSNSLSECYCEEQEEIALEAINRI